MSKVIIRDVRSLKRLMGYQHHFAHTENNEKLNEEKF